MTTMMGVPAIYLFLAQEPGFADADLSSLARAVVGGAPMPEALLETWAARGIDDRPGLRADRGGAERALPAARGRGAQDRLRRQAVPVRRRAALGDEDELQVRGPNVFPGYWRNAEATARRSPRRLAAHGRRRRARRRGLLPDQGPPQGHVHLRRRERLSGRGRGGAARASARRGRGGRRRAGRALGRGRRGVRRRRRRHRRGAARALPRAARALQGAEARALRRRDPAQRPRTRSRSSALAERRCRA